MTARPAARRRIGAHLSTAGGVERAVERAHAIGADTLQIFSASPRMWRSPRPDPAAGLRVAQARQKYGIGPLVIHTGYLVNLSSATDEFREKSIVAFRGEVERALALGAEYLVLHPGSSRGLGREQGLQRAAESVESALDGIPWQDADFTVLIENTAGSDHSLGGSFEQVAELIDKLRPCAPVAACLDTCHTHVAGYDIVSRPGYDETMRQLEQTIGAETVRVWHANDARAARGSRLDRHQHIGQGRIGSEPFRWLLADRRFRHCAFIAETPVDHQGDEASNVQALRSLAGGARRRGRAPAAEG